jgi:hypothetical protein
VVYLLIRNIREYGFRYFGYRLVKFLFARVAFLYTRDETFKVDIGFVY